MSGLALAQNDRGVLTGTVQDPGHAMIAEASITARNIATGALYETKSTATGSYTLPSLPPGIYELTVVAPGFAKYIGENTEIHVAEVVNVNIALTLGAVTESVTVDATAPLLQSESNDQSFTVTTNEMTDLPLAASAGGRTPQSLMSLSPGVAGTAPGTGGRVDGMPGGTGRLMVDGQDTTNINGNSGHTGPPPQETIQEFTFLTSNYSAEYSQALGGVWVMASRTGTNAFHGSAFEYWQNDALNSNRPWVYTKALVRQNDLNGALSGPVIIPKLYNGRNKTFFSIDFEGARSSITSGDTLSNLPTTAMRAGNFSASLTGRTLTGTDPLGNPYLENTIYDPLTTATAPNGTPYRTPFAGNVIPTSRLDPVALKIQALIPLPILGGVTNNWVVSPRFALISLQPYVKVDHYISPAMKISFFNFRPSNISPEDVDGLPLPISAEQKPNDVTWIERINYDYTITPAIVLHLGVGMFRFSNPASSPASVLNYNASGLLGFNGSSVGVGFPRITGLNSSDGGGLTPSIGPAGEDIQFYTKFTAPFSLLWVRNNHQIKFGGEFHQEIFSDNEREGTGGILNFSPNETGDPSTNGQSLGGGGVGLGYASFLLGQVDSATIQPPQDLEWRNRRYGLYLQDSWKITRKLTIDYGIRWDLQGQGHELYNRDSMFGPTIPNPSAGGLLGGIVYEGLQRAAAIATSPELSVRRRSPLRLRVSGHAENGPPRRLRHDLRFTGQFQHLHRQPRGRRRHQPAAVQPAFLRRCLRDFAERPPVQSGFSERRLPQSRHPAHSRQRQLSRLLHRSQCQSSRPGQFFQRESAARSDEEPHGRSGLRGQSRRMGNRRHRPRKSERAQPRYAPRGRV